MLLWLLFCKVGFPCGSVVKNLPANAGDSGLFPGSGRSPGGRNGNPLQYFCLENPMDREARQALVHGIAKESDTTEQLHFTSLHFTSVQNRASLVAQTVKNLPAMLEPRFNPWMKKIPWRREWQPTPVSLPGEFHGKSSLVGYSNQREKTECWLPREREMSCCLTTQSSTLAR